MFRWLDWRAGLGFALLLGASYASTAELRAVFGEPDWLAWALGACVAALLLLAVCWQSGLEPAPLRAVRGAWEGRVTLGCLCLLPLCEERGLGEALRVALLAGAAAAHAARVSAPLTERWPFRIASLCVVLAIVCVYVACGSKLTGSTNNDAAYYYGIARHMLTSGRFEEPLVWHFLVKPSEVVHTPFDYWHGLTSLALLPALWAFGTSYTVVGIFMALVSSTAVVLFWYLVARALPLRSAWLQMASVLLFAFSPSMIAYRFDAESIPHAQVWVLASLVAFARGRLVIAVLCAYALFLARAETVSVMAILWLCAAIAAWRGGHARALGRVLGAATLCVISYTAYHSVLFGSIAPPGAALAPFIRENMDLYRFRGADMATRDRLFERLNFGYFDARLGVALETFRANPFLKGVHVWLALALIGGVRNFRSVSDGKFVVLVLLFGGASAITLLNPTVFAYWRSFHALLPLLLLAGAYGLDSLVERLERRARDAVRARLYRAAGAAVVAGLAVLALEPLELYRAPPAEHSLAEPVRKAAALMDGGAVLCQAPWFVLAYAGLPAITTPYDGVGAMQAAIEAYQPRWFLQLTGAECPAGNASCTLLTTPGLERVGIFELKTVQRDAAHVLYRILPPKSRE